MNSFWFRVRTHIEWGILFVCFLLSITEGDIDTQPQSKYSATLIFLLITSSFLLACFLPSLYPPLDRKNTLNSSRNTGSDSGLDNSQVFNFKQVVQFSGFCVPYMSKWTSIRCLPTYCFSKYLELVCTDRYKRSLKCITVNRNILPSTAQIHLSIKPP